MEEVRRVMRPQVMVHRREESRGCITGRLPDLAMPAGQGVVHQGMPGVLSTCSRLLRSDHVVAHRVDPSQAEPPGTRVILRSGEVCGWHVAREARPLLLAIGHDGLLHTTGAVVLRPLRGADKPLEARDPQAQTDEAHPTGPHCGGDEVERHNQPMQEGEPRNTAKKRHDHRALIAALVVGSPGLQGAAGNLQGLRGLTLGEALGVQGTILRQEVSAFETIPALVAILVALRLLLPSCAHSDLLGHPLALVS